MASEPDVRGVVLHLRPMELSVARIDSLRDLVGGLRAAGKRVVCWSSSYTNSTYQVACAADEILLQPGGMIDSLGFAREYVFLADALERAGVQADFVQITPYKTAADALTKRGLTPEAREMAEWLPDSNFAQLVFAVTAGRHCSEAAARELIDGAPYTDLGARTAGAVDDLLSEEDLPARLKARLQGWSQARRRLRRPRPPRPGRVVGLIRVEGTIVDGRSRRAPFKPPLRPPLLFEDQSGDLTVVQQARSLAANRRVGAVVLWVESGGGSATASEAMARLTSFSLIAPTPRSMTRRLTSSPTSIRTSASSRASTEPDTSPFRMSSNSWLSPFSIDVKPKHGSPDFARDVAFQKIANRMEGVRMASAKLRV